jgi:hypothetical protein
VPGALYVAITHLLEFLETGRHGFGIFKVPLCVHPKNRAGSTAFGIACALELVAWSSIPATNDFSAICSVVQFAAHAGG